jgi:hypothetical protein
MAEEDAVAVRHYQQRGSDENHTILTWAEINN